MKKLLTNKNFIQKIMILLIAIILINFVAPIKSKAGVGGMLLEPVSDLFTTVTDAILSVLQACLYNGSLTDYSISNFMNILLGAGYFVTNTEHYPEMVYNDYGGTVEPVKISEKEFQQISFYSILGLITEPVVGGIKLAGELTGVTKTYSIPTIQYTVDKIFAGKIPAFDINFINPTYSEKNYVDENGDGKDDKTGYLEEDFNIRNKKSIAVALHNGIASWYVALRNLAFVGLLSVLLYVGIRIIISSTASDKAKYKQMLMDWLVAICLLFVLHYIMSFTITIINKITESISSGSTISIPVIIETDGWNIVSAFDGNLQFNTDLMGLTRLQIQYEDFTRKLVYLILYIGLVTYTVKYTWIYMKRTITMAFLTLMAPIVALTYPIDKLNDGKAQAFNSWFKEYIFTALLQPFHLIIYTILLGSAINIAATNPIYAIMVLAFMGPAEKMLRKFFGFDKASTPGALSQAGAMFGGAAAYGLLKKGVGYIASRGKGQGGKDNIRTKPVEDNNAPSGYDALAENGWNENRNSDQTQEGNPPPSGQPLEGGQQQEDGQNSSPQSGPSETSNEQGEGSPLPETQSPETSDEQGEGSPLPEPQPPIEQGDEPTKPIRWRRAKGLHNSFRNWAHKNPYTGKAWDMAALPYRTRKEWVRTHGGTRRKAIIGAVGSAGKFVARNAGKIAGAAVGAAVLGAVGVGMGIAGDDLEDVLKYGAGGAVLGGSLAPGLGRRVANSSLGQAYGRARYGSDNAAQTAAQAARLRASGEVREQVANRYMDKNGNRPTEEELDKLEERAIAHYNAGFTDEPERNKVMKIEDKIKGQLDKKMPEEEKDKKAQKMAQTIGKLARDIDPKKLSDNNYVDGKYKEFKKGIQDANPNLASSAVEQNAKQSMNLIMSYYKKPLYFK